MKYKVTFEFMALDYEISDGKWHEDYLDDNGQGFTFDEAERVVMHLRQQSVMRVRNVDVIEMSGRN